MAITFARECRFPNDLANASQALSQEIGDAIIANQVLLDAAVAAIGTMPDTIDEALGFINDILKLGNGESPLRTTEAIAEEFGLQKDKPTRIDDEKFLFNAGITITDGVLYVDGSKSTNPLDSANIEILRRLFIALGRDLKRTEDALSNAEQSSKTFFILSKL